MTILIAEIGQNHNGDLNLAKKMIKIARDSGADIVKFQFYDATKLFSKKNNPWYQYNLKTEISYQNIEELYKYSVQLGIEFMASTFDVKRLKFLDQLGVKRHKIASRSISDLDLITACIETEKDVLISLGYWHEKEFPKFTNSSKIKYLYCISRYPTEIKDIQFSEVDFNRFKGFSDHTIGVDATKIAISRGAKFIEKHFTLDKEMYGPDHSCSMLPSELEELNRFRKIANQCI